MDKKRTIMPNGRYTDDELILLKNTFAENLPLIKILRKVMLQLDMAEGEEIIWRKTFGNKDLSDLMRKIFLPTIDGDAPIDGIIDLWMTVDLNNKLSDEVKTILKSRELTIQYLDAQLKELSGEARNDKKFNQFDVLNSVELIARNTIALHVEQQLRAIFGLAGFKKETPEETIKRIHQNSNK